ncbi:MAG: LON peptidase substrate-binding domain-containing protein [Anaerolineae bacterium]|jgi:Lon protease-like protein
MMALEEWSDLALFPLKTVLFPGMVLPLHIFEERYKLMINRCVEQDRPFGVVLIREGSEVGEHAQPYDVGTTTIVAGLSRFEDGRMNIVTIGSDRFRLRGLRHDQPYLVGDAEPWPLTGAGTERVEAQVGPMRALLHQYLTLLAQAEGHKINIEEIPNDPRALALLVAITLQLPMPQKQRLLEQPTVLEMLLAERAILRREQLILNGIIQTQQDQWEGGYSGYLAKN